MPIPSEAPWLIFDLEIDPLLDIAYQTRKEGADFIVLSLHWGVEYQSAPTKEQRSLAESLLADENIDLIVGHHAHVIQPVGMVDDEYVIYGIGNFLSNQSASCCAVGTQDGVIVEVELTESDDGIYAERVLVTPTRVARYDGYRILDVGNLLIQNPDSNELISSWERTLERLGAENLGDFSPLPTTLFIEEK